MKKPKYISCKDLEKSLFLAPSELRACCQRFFHNGKMRGDANLIKIEKNETPTIKEIIKAREKIFNEIQNKKSESCTGCHHLYETDNKPNFNTGITYLSVEQHTFCNLRCSYCSDMFYGGKKPNYNVTNFVKTLSQEGYFKNLQQVVWGGGEPTLDKSFEILVKEINTHTNPEIYHRIFTNSVRYSPALAKFLKEGLVKIVTSVDAGTEDTFKKVRGRSKFHEVFQNLKEYSKINSNKVTIKYILTDENKEEIELDNFVNTCVQYDLQNCAFQISMDYKSEEIKLDTIKKISFLVGQLKKNNIKKIFCDDHIARRFKTLSIEQKTELEKYVAQKNIKHVMINNQNIKNINIYGMGKIAENIISKTNFLKMFDKVNLYDSDSKKIGSKIDKYVIQDPEFINKNNDKIIILTAQTYSDIYENLLRMKINENRVVTGLII